MIPENIFCQVAVVGGGLDGLAATNYLTKNGIDAKLFVADATAFGRTFTQVTDAEAFDCTVVNEMGLKTVAYLNCPIERIEQANSVVRLKGRKIIFANYVIMAAPTDDKIELIPSVEHLSLVYFAEKETFLRQAEEMMTRVKPAVLTPT